MRRLLGLSIAVLLLTLVLPALADDDVALHRPVSDNCQYDRTSDSLCVDGDSLSEYDSGHTAPVWVEVDFGSDTPVTFVRLIPAMRPEGQMTVTIFGRDSQGITYTLATWTGYARHRQPIVIPIPIQTPVRFLNVSVLSSSSRVGWFTVQCIKGSAVVPTRIDTWGRLKALYR